jgi:hypothetical protein
LLLLNILFGFIFAKSLAASEYRSCWFIILEAGFLMARLEEIPKAVHRYILEDKEAVLPNRCLICGNHPFFVGHIEKSFPTRMLIYCLCKGCYEKTESAVIVEKIICYYETTRSVNPKLLEHRGAC